MDKNIVNLFEKYLNNRCSDEELETVLTFIKAGTFLDEWNHVLTLDAASLLENENDIPIRSEILRLQTHHRLINSMNAHEKSQTRKTFKITGKWIPIAAAASVLIFFGWWFYTTNDSYSDQITYHNDIAPGKSGARLRLSSGKVISLDGSKTGLVVRNQQLSYNDGTELEPAGTAAAEKTYTAWTDNGNMYMLTLSDGTQVWLNAGSQLDFPAKFTGLRRQVRLKGEAFFKVTKNKSMPFIVESKGQRVEVLGTAFNINSYPDEQATKTTLVEGSISISSDDSKFTLKPGQQAVLNPTGSLIVSNADTTLAAAWKNNKFIFENNDIQSVMRMIQRWYNVEVIYTTLPPDVTFGGKISRFENVSAVLRVLERTGGVHFKTEGKKIYVFK